MSRVMPLQDSRPRPFPPAACALLLALGAAAAPASAQTLRGSPASVQRAFDSATARGLMFQGTRRAIDRAARAGSYVRLASGSDYRLHGVASPYVLPATRTVLAGLAASYRRACGERLVVTSAMRPATLRLRNGNALSVHPTGMAVDLRSPRGRCRAWLRTSLLALEREGAVDATEERFPAHFHLVVFREVEKRPALATAVRRKVVPARRTR
jgi:hypothetical protein